MKAEQITWKSTACRKQCGLERATEYRVLFSDLSKATVKILKKVAAIHKQPMSEEKPVLEIQGIMDPTMAEEMPNYPRPFMLLNVKTKIFRQEIHDFHHLAIKSEELFDIYDQFMTICEDEGAMIVDSYVPEIVTPRKETKEKIVEEVTVRVNKVTERKTTMAVTVSKGKKFQTGLKYLAKCWMNGNAYFYTCIERTKNAVKLVPSYYESDGIHTLEPEEFPLQTESNGNEYIVTQTYNGEENRVYGMDGKTDDFGMNSGKYAFVNYSVIE